MKNLKKWALIFTLAGPAVINLSCTSGALRQFWTAAMEGAADFVQATTFDLLDSSF